MEKAKGIKLHTAGVAASDCTKSHTPYASGERWRAMRRFRPKLTKRREIWEANRCRKAMAISIAWDSPLLPS
eukprot:1141360-Pelagomonas_calceolata.AAC.9